MSETTNIIYNKLWDLLSHPTPDHVVRLFAKKGDRTIGDFAQSPKEFEVFTNACKDMNVYIALNPTTRKDGTRHSSNDVTHLSFFVLDIDPVEDNAQPDMAMIEYLTVLSNYCGHDLFKKPPTILDTGRGFQVWLRGVDVEFNESSITRKQASKIMNYWMNKLMKRLPISNGCKLDTSVSDLPRVLRMPGTINQKTGKEAHFLEIQKEPFPWLFPFLIWGTPNEVLVEPEIVIKPGATWQDVFSRLTPSAQEYLTRGLCEPGRHKRVYHTARSLAEHGISLEETRKAIYRANQLQGESEELDEKAIEHALKKAYENLQETA